VYQIAIIRTVEKNQKPKQIEYYNCFKKPITDTKLCSHNSVLGLVRQLSVTIWLFLVRSCSVFVFFLTVQTRLLGYPMCIITYKYIWFVNMCSLGKNSTFGNFTAPSMNSSSDSSAYNIHSYELRIRSLLMLTGFLILGVILL
jgi:hypothetical protein